MVSIIFQEEEAEETAKQETVEADPEPEEEEVEKRKPKKIPNQFNFCERAALTYNNPIRVNKYIR